MFFYVIFSMKQIPFASYRLRLYAFLLDAFLFGGVVMLLRLYLLPYKHEPFFLEMVQFLLIIGIFILYLTLFEVSSIHATLGKLFFRLAVVDIHGAYGTFTQILLRNIIKVFTVVYLFLFIFRFETINNSLLLAVFLSISTNPIWHNFMTITGGEKHIHKLVHDEVAKTTVIKK